MSRPVVAFEVQEHGDERWKAFGTTLGLLPAAQEFGGITGVDVSDSLAGLEAGRVVEGFSKITGRPVRMRGDLLGVV